MINEKNYAMEYKKYRELKKKVKLMYLEIKKYREEKKPPKKEKKREIDDNFKLSFD